MGSTFATKLRHLIMAPDEKLQHNWSDLDIYPWSDCCNDIYVVYHIM